MTIMSGKPSLCTCPNSTAVLKCQVEKWRCAVCRGGSTRTSCVCPAGAEEPAKCFERGLVPIALLRPGDLAVDIDKWLNAATKPLEPNEAEADAFKKLRAYSDLKDKIKGEITTLRERVTHFNLPYLSLPADTNKAVALQVFINMNTNSQPLSLYDIIVAEVESVVGTSLHTCRPLSTSIPQAQGTTEISRT